ncbi:MAG: PhoU domain-containing protein [Pseudolabrys sp.]
MNPAMNTAMPAHTRTIFDADLQDLAGMVAEMSGLAERQIAQAFDALVQRNSALARQIIDLDANLDAFQAKIEAKAISMIAQRQPLRLTFEQ